MWILMGFSNPEPWCFAGKRWARQKIPQESHKEKRENLKIEEAKEISYEKERKNKPVKS